jgi:probable HAF family extracellular repeat protein
MKAISSRKLLVGSLVAAMTLLMEQSAAVQSGSVPPGYELISIAFDGSALAVNNSGQVVGFEQFAGGWAAFSWTATGGRVMVAGSGGLYQENRAVAVNDSGQVAGFYSLTRSAPYVHHALLWTLANGIQDLGTLGGTNSEATAIDASGHITGWSDTVAGPRHAFSWTATGGMRDLGTLGGENSTAVAINDIGRVVGWSEIGGAHHAFSWTASDGMVDLGTLGGANSEAVAVNASDRVVGWSEWSGAVRHAFSWTPAGGIVDLGTLGGMRSEATAVSSTGQVVGWSEIAIGDTAVHAFSWTPAGGMLDLGTLGGRDSQARAVNTAGQVVGRSTLPDGHGHAFSWTPTAAMVDLGTLGVPIRHGVESDANAINERGDIVGRSTAIPDMFAYFYATMWRRLQGDDVTSPTLHLPATIVVDATSAAGATVTYTVSATDDQDPNPVVACTPASGSVFPLLASTVSCTATDAAGNTATGTFQVMVLNAPQQLQDTIDLIAGYHLTRLGTSLPDKLQLAIGFSTAGDVVRACEVMTAFLNQVRAQSGKALTVEQAAELTARTIRIRNVLGC